MSGFQLSNDAPTAYSEFAVHIMAPWTDDLIEQGLCEDGNRVLDLACGTGFVANRVNQVSKSTCNVVGVDINSAMLDVVRKNATIEWHLASAASLPFQDGSFDVVLCQQGLQFFPDRGAAPRLSIAAPQPKPRRLQASTTHSCYRVEIPKPPCVKLILRQVSS